MEFITTLLFVFSYGNYYIIKTLGVTTPRARPAMRNGGHKVKSLMELF